MQIESTQNPKIKNLLKLQEKSRERKKQELFVAEGVQENRFALDSGFIPREFFVCDEIFENSIKINHSTLNLVSLPLFQKIAYRGTTGGIIGLYEIREKRLEEIVLSAKPLVVILESVEKPGNLGAVLRSCDGAGIDALIVCDPLADFYNPNVIRSSVGTVFTNQLASDTRENVISWLKSKEIKIVSTYLNERTKNLYDIDLTGSSALVFGTENSGLTADWREHSDELAKIPMNGKVDSLNVSNAAAICIYEALRQRHHSKSL